MTKEMLIDIIKDLRHKNKILLICLIVSILILIGVTAFAFSDFDFTYEKTTTYTSEQNAETQGDNSEINQTIEIPENWTAIYITAGAVIIGMLILTFGGILIYGKSTSKNHDKEENQNPHRKEISIQEEEINGKADKD